MDIAGIGNALLDVFCFSDDEASLALGLHPNAAAHVSPERFEEILLGIPSPVFVSGGSASNSVKAAALLGKKTAFYGCVGSEEREPDRWASIFRDDLADCGVDCRLETRAGTTGRCLMVHMPGSLKAIACAPGAAPSFRDGQIGADDLASARVVLIDGQFLRDERHSGEVIALCRDVGASLALDIASADIATNRATYIANLLERESATLFMNEEEGEAFSRALFPEGVPGEGKDFVDYAMGRLSAKSGGACIAQKRGPLGARIWIAGELVEAPTTPCEAPLDDTGAGDVFNGAFLSARLSGFSPKNALAFANEAARLSLSAPGSRLDAEAFAILRERLATR